MWRKCYILDAERRDRGEPSFAEIGARHSSRRQITAIIFMVGRFIATICVFRIRAHAGQMLDASIVCRSTPYKWHSWHIRRASPRDYRKSRWILYTVCLRAALPIATDAEIIKNSRRSIDVLLFTRECTRRAYNAQHVFELCNVLYIVS